MDKPTWKAVPGCAEKEGDDGAHARIDRPGARLGDLVARSPPQEVKKKRLLGPIPCNPILITA